MPKYFASYWWASQEKQGNGNVTFNVGEEIISEEDIRNAERMIAEKQGCSEVILINFIKL